MATAPFPVNPELTAIAIAYKNPDTALIADQAMPRIKAVGKREFQYDVYDLSMFNRPDTLVGRKGRPNQVSMSAKRETAAIEDYGLDDPIPQDDIDQARADGRNLPGESTEYIMNLVSLDRECRVAGIVQNAANYAPANVKSLSGADQWTDAASTPLDDLLNALDAPLMRPNTAVISGPVWSLLRRHPQIVKTLYPVSGEGVITRQQLADLLEIKTLLVGTSFVNNARKGQQAVLSRTWGNHCALLYLDSAASTSRGVTWGMTVPYGTAVSGSIQDKDIGLRGGLVVRSGESLKELVTAKDAGYLIKNCIKAA